MAIKDTQMDSLSQRAPECVAEGRMGARRVAAMVRIRPNSRNGKWDSLERVTPARNQ